MTTASKTHPRSTPRTRWRKPPPSLYEPPPPWWDDAALWEDDEEVGTPSRPTEQAALRNLRAQTQRRWEE